MTTQRTIRQVAVLGSGVMGSRIACHFANAGFRVLLLDIVPKDANDAASRNRIVNDALQAALKSSPSPIYQKSFAGRITTGNFDDDLQRIAQCDWIIEVIVERADIKQSLFEKAEKYRKPGTLITSNTSGIPMHLLTEGRSDDFKAHFCGTHFFNPPRYLRLLEIIPGADTKPEVIDFLMDFGQRFLGKTTVLCKDTPAFIANRVGVFSIQFLFHTIKGLGLTVEEVDKLTGPVMGRPKSATFRTCDVVGLDTLIHVAKGLAERCTSDEQHAMFAIPDYVQKMAGNGWIGDKNKQGFYKKTKNEKGEKEILSLNLETLEYAPQKKVRFATLEQAKAIDSLQGRTRVLYGGQDKAGDFYRLIFHHLFAYVSHRVPEISDDLYRVDDAMKAGFGWELGAFETWDVVGVKEAATAMKAAGVAYAPWVDEMLAAGVTSFYRTENGQLSFYDIALKSYKPVPGQEHKLELSQLPESSIVWKNTSCTVRDIGDGILALSWSTKMNTIGGDVLAGIQKAIDLAEASYNGLVIYNDGEHFSAGANVGMIFMMAAEQELEELDVAVRLFQRTTMRIRYSSIPVVVAPHSLTLGGGCEVCLHADAVVAHAETYMGLVEFGVGVIPGGGGTKEFALRCADEIHEGDIRTNTFRNRFLTIGQAKVSTSAHEAFELGYLRNGIDEVVMNRSHQLIRAKEVCLQMHASGYAQPIPRTDITVPGQEALGLVYVGANSMYAGNYISEHDQFISNKLGYVLCGGDLSAPTKVSEQYLLDLERKAFLELCMQRKSLERMQSLVTTGKILRN
ncbi:MAG: 3-hydroxyacyl-CoA dehydrogenase NAD-binding domain-containing protein [Flavobacteriales bacterium]